MGLVAGLNSLASGDGHWTVGIPNNDSIAIDDPGIENQISLVQLTIDLQSNAPSTMTFTGPNPSGTADSIGFTAFVQYNVINDTGTDLSGLALNLVNAEHRIPNLVPGVIEFGDSVNANYAYFTDIQPVAGQPSQLFSPDGNPTTPTGPAASTLALLGGIPAGGSINGALIMHNTELATGSNNFSMNILPLTGT